MRLHLVWPQPFGRLHFQPAAAEPSVRLCLVATATAGAVHWDDVARRVPAALALHVRVEDGKPLEAYVASELRDLAQPALPGSLRWWKTCIIHG